MANGYTLTNAFEKSLKEYYATQSTVQMVEHSLPATPLELWKKLNELGFFLSNWGGVDAPWQPTARQWQWLRWSLAQEGCHMFLGARGIGKTEILTIFRIVWMVCEDQATSILLITGTHARAKEIIRLVRNMLEALAIPLQGDAETVVRTLANRSSKHPTVYSASIGKKIKGDHPKLIIIEDPLDEKEGYSAKKKETVMKTINEARRMANEKVFMIGQFVSEDDPYAQFCQEGKIAILTAWASQCPELIRTKKEDFVVEGNQMLEYSWAINMEGRFPPRDGELFAKIPVVEQMPTSYITAVLDPSFNGRDRTALAVGGTYYDDALGYDVLVAWVFSWESGWHGTIPYLVEICDLLRVDKFYYEGKRYQEIEETLGDMGIHAEGFDTTINKLYKIEHASGYVGLGRLALHQSNSEASIQSIRRWHVGLPHDDEVDALAMLVYRVFDLEKKRTRRFWAGWQA